MLLSGLISESLTALSMEFTSSSESFSVIILAPMVSIFSLGSPKYSVIWLISMYSLER